MSLIEQALADKGIIPGGQGVAQKNDPPFQPIGPYLHGQNGIFNRRDRSNPVFSAMMTPNMGVADSLPVINGMAALDGGSAFGGEDAVFESLITGMTAGDLDDFANQPTAPCEDGPTGGLLKFCSMVNTFGNYKMSTRELEIDRAGRVADRVDAFAVQVANQFPQGLFAVPSDTPTLANAVNNELAMRIWEMVTSFQRMFAPRVFTGSPVNNDGEARDIVGLDIHINSGNKIDSTFQAICTAANSDVKDFQSNIIGSLTGRNIMQYIEMADAFVMFKARKQGLGTPTYEIAMRPELWQELSEIIPVQKYEKIIAVINRVTNGRAMLDASGAFDERNAIRASMLIPVNGRFLPVVLDDTIPETSIGKVNGTPAYTSTIYGIPLTVLGGVPVTFWQTFNHANGNEMAIQARAAGLTWVTDGGLFRWFSDFSKGCLKLNAKFTPRLRMRTPQIAWRINNVGYAPLQHFDSWDPNSVYHTDGGVSVGQEQKYYSAWSPSAPGNISW
jgi:hypothetical protein